MDYILLGIHCSRLGYANLRFAAGDNLTRVPFIGPRFVSLGAFPICRDRVTSRRYVFGLCEDVAAMLEDGDNVIVFPEGGRSYDGAMLRMKAGLVAANLLAQLRSPRRPHCYLPFAVSYEVLPEMGFLGWVEKGRRLRREAGGALARAAGSLLYYGGDLAAFARFALAGRFGGGFGSVYLDYGEPFEVASIVDVDTARPPDAETALVAHQAAARRLAAEIGRRLACLYRILPLHVVALELTRGRTSLDDMAGRIPAAVDLLARQGRNCRSLEALSAAEVVEEGTAQLRRLGAVTVRGRDVRPARADIVSYHARTMEPSGPGAQGPGPGF